MPRSYRTYLQDILSAIAKIDDYIAGLEVDVFKQTSIVIDSVGMNLVIIGEAARNVPESIRQKYPDVEWRNIVDLRNVITHEYFRLNLDRIWDITQVELPKLREQINLILESEQTHGEE